MNPRHASWSAILLLTSVMRPAVAGPVPGVPADAIQQHAVDLHWQAGPVSLPAGIQTVVLEGDPHHAGLFTLRLRAPAGTQLAPHTHPRAERVTVIRGTVGVGFGSLHDATTMTRFAAGDYYVNPALSAHYVDFLQDAELQVTTEGPWALDFITR